MAKICAQCGKECTNEYYKCLDNFLQVKYFDDEDCNCFCSPECFCESLFLESFEIEDGDEE